MGSLQPLTWLQYYLAHHAAAVESRIGWPQKRRKQELLPRHWHCDQAKAATASSPHHDTVQCAPLVLSSAHESPCSSMS